MRREGGAKKLRALTAAEKQAEQSIIDSVGEVALLMPTPTGMRKSIMDATFPVRMLLSRTEIHDFSVQAQGPQHKVVLRAVFHTDVREHPVDVSLYRPVTKQGDPRIWVYKLPMFAGAGEMLALFVIENRLHFVNLTRTRLSQNKNLPISEFFQGAQKALNPPHWNLRHS